MSYSCASDRIERLVDVLRRAHDASPSLEQFAGAAGPLLVDSEITIADLACFVQHQWDPNSCLPHLVDTDSPPFLIDLYTYPDWCLRATIWPGENETDWKDVPHSHFGFISTTAITDIAYRVRVYPSFDKMEDEVGAEPFRRGDLHFIGPSTIHEVLLPVDSFGVSVSLRTRAVRQMSEEWNRRERRIELRTKSALVHEDERRRPRARM